jgi:riboflavin synthase
MKGGFNMFSGIVEGFGTVVKIEKEQENMHLSLTCPFAGELKVDQSLSHNGVCLTVVEVNQAGNTYKVTAIKETLLKTNLGLLEVGSKVNLERSMMMNGRLDGHIVQGHVDQTATCVKVEEAEGSWYFTFEYAFDLEKAKQGYMTVEKGSVTVNGVSLTVVNSKDNSFQVAIIPFTYEVTNFHTFRIGSVVNLEFDIIGKYLSKLNSFNK